MLVSAGEIKQPETSKFVSQLLIAPCSARLRGILHTGNSDRQIERKLIDLFAQFEQYPLKTTTYIKGMAVHQEYTQDQLGTIWTRFQKDEVEAKQLADINKLAEDRAAELRELDAQAKTDAHEAKKDNTKRMNAMVKMFTDAKMFRENVAFFKGQSMTTEEAIEAAKALQPPPTEAEAKDEAKDAKKAAKKAAKAKAEQAKAEAEAFEASLQAAEAAAASEAAVEAEALAKQAKRVALQAAQPPAPPTTTPKSLLDTLTDKVEEMEFHQRVAEKSAARAAKAAGRKRSLAEQLAAA